MKLSCTLPVVSVLLHNAGFTLAEGSLKFPFVAMGEAGEDSYEWQDFHAQVMEVNNDVTTYSVGCATEPCAGWENLPEFTYTIAIGQNTFDMKYSDEPFMSTHTACTFTGTPATEASCEMTQTGTIGTYSDGYEHHFTVPNETGLWNVMTATLKLVDGTVAPTSGSSGSASPGTTPPPSVTAITGTRSGSASGGGQTPSTVQSSGMAQGTVGAAPWVLGMGIAAGALAGI